VSYWSCDKILSFFVEVKHFCKFFRLLLGESCARIRKYSNTKQRGPWNLRGPWMCFRGSANQNLTQKIR